MIKRLLLILIALSLLLNITVSAQSDIKIVPYGDFFTIAEHKEKVAEIINIPSDKLDDYCKQKHIEYIAVNSDNSKQIRIACATTDFSNSVVNISLLSDDKITELIPQITDISGVTGKVIDKNGQKFIKTELRSKDSGGEYILTQYFTVADKKSYTLSFYTNFGDDLDYTEKTFESYESDIFLKDTAEEKSFLNFALPIGATVFALAFIIIAITVIKDLIKKHSLKKEETDN